jgi:hypothetical protein
MATVFRHKGLSNQRMYRRPRRHPFVKQRSGAAPAIRIVTGDQLGPVERMGRRTLRGGTALQFTLERVSRTSFVDFLRNGTRNRTNDGWNSP